MSFERPADPGPNSYLEFTTNPGKLASIARIPVDLSQGRWMRVPPDVLFTVLDQVRYGEDVYMRSPDLRANNARETIYAFGDGKLLFSEEYLDAQVGERHIILSPEEHPILLELAHQDGNPIRPVDLARRVYADLKEEMNASAATNRIRSHISKIRYKFGRYDLGHAELGILALGVGGYYLRKHLKDR